MLTLTENATIAVKSLTEQLSTDTGGLRISEAVAPEKGYALNLAQSPEPEDTVVESGGARVFVDPATSVALDKRVLDAQVSDDGSVGFALADQR
jgi:Fe-S cluster assembly iron-binding protein IscA